MPSELRRQPQNMIKNEWMSQQVIGKPARFKLSRQRSGFHLLPMRINLKSPLEVTGMSLQRTRFPTLAMAE
jgi:hypothetical protein